MKQIPVISRPGRHLEWVNGYVFKDSGPKEVAAYMIWEKFRAELANSDLGISIVFPQVLPHEISSQLKLERLPNYAVLNIMQHFGSYDLPDSVTIEDYLASILLAIDKIGIVFQGLELPYDNNEESLKTLEHWLIKDSALTEKATGINFTELLFLLQTTQPYVEDSLSHNQLVAAHRDTSPGNIRCKEIRQDGIPIVQTLDLESFGLALPGYDQARVFTFLSANEERQRLLIDLLSRHGGLLTFEERKAYFWRTVAVRAYREIQILLSGYHDTNLDNLPEAEPEAAKQRLVCELVRSFREAQSAILEL